MTSFCFYLSYCTAWFQKKTSKLFSVSASVPSKPPLLYSAARSNTSRHWTVRIYSDSLILQMDKPLVYFCSRKDGFTSYTDVRPDHGCSSVSPCACYGLACHRSPRLLTNGYYILTEDSFLSDEDGNITTSPSQTSVSYKERLVRIFRRRRRIRRSLVTLFNISGSNSWLNSTFIESPRSEGMWPEEGNKVDDTQCYDKESVTVRNGLYPVIMLSLYLIIYLYVRFVWGVLLPDLLVCSLLIIILICSSAVLHYSPDDTSSGQSVEPA
ncbi:transmembrane protein 71 isoform X2 [Sceloporus undulatus]|uniref:transmembrane protein 71 isoform X2 n=1 Tax=Sceloporus undulatus TaxID=8520 RepID=UPI001C4D7A38|nr:transmembrane protein 71 isoform X2 [Sceloporus undulatus]